MRNGEQWNIFSRFYIERYNLEQNIFQCLFPIELPDHTGRNENEIYRIIGHKNHINGERAYILVQYEISGNFTEKEKHEFRARGQISWERIEDVQHYDRLEEYFEERRQGKYYFSDSNGSLNGFKKRKVKKSAKITDGISISLLEMNSSIFFRIIEESYSTTDIDNEYINYFLFT